MRLGILRWLLSAAMVFGVCAAKSRASEEPIVLEVSREAGQLTRVSAKLEVRGDLVAAMEGKTNRTPLAIVGEMRYDERVVEYGAAVTDASCSVRHYDQAEAHITVDGQRMPIRGVSEEKRLVAVRLADAEASLFTPHGQFSRDELDLLTLPFNTLALDRLAPREAIAVGQSAKVPAKAAALLCGVDEVDSCEVQTKLTAVTADEARFDLSGKLQAAVAGISTEIELAGKFIFHRRVGRITWLAVSVKEKRGVGHVAPGVEATSRLQLTVAPLEESIHLAADRIASLNLEGDAGQRLLWHTSPSRKFRFAHDRRWHVINDDERVTVLRLVDRGDLIAQANVTPLPQGRAGRAITLDSFKSDVQKVLGKNLGGIVKAAERVNSQNYRVLRLEAVGKVNDLDIEWIYYHLTDPEGNAIAASFTLEPKYAERFAGSDDAIINSLEMTHPAAKEEAAEGPDRSVLRK